MDDESIYFAYSDQFLYQIRKSEKTAVVAVNLFYSRYILGYYFALFLRNMTAYQQHFFLLSLYLLLISFFES